MTARPSDELASAQAATAQALFQVTKFTPPSAPQSLLSEWRAELSRQPLSMSEAEACAVLGLEASGADGRRVYCMLLQGCENGLWIVKTLGVFA